jgi:hypothetical protein
MLNDRNIDWDFEANHRITDVREVEGIQVRLEEHRAPKEQVGRYATAMKHGANFPAIVLNEDELVDGNTRVSARRRNGEDTIPAYRCHGLTALQARSLSVELNQSNGLAMTEKEIRNFVVTALEEGADPEVRSLARMTGVRENKIQRWIAEARFEARAAQSGISQTLIDALPESTRASLHAVRLAPVFRELTALAAEARMPALEVKAIVGKVNSAPSESDALAIVASERDARASEIRAVASGFKPRARRSKGSAQHIGGLVKFGTDELLDVAPEKQYETFVRIKELRDRLEQVIERAEREWNLTPPAEGPGASSDETTGTPAMATVG